MGKSTCLCVGVGVSKTTEKYGIQKGDIVIKIGEIEVPDMMGYMTGLSKHEKGDSTIVVVNRNNKKMKFPIVFQ